MEILDRPSPNHGPRASAGPIDILLLHYTGMESAENALTWLCDVRSEVSSHYFVFEDGRVARLVSEARRAQHAGVANWAGETDINSRSIGIEIANPGHEFGYGPFPPAQIDALTTVCKGILGRHPIPPQRVLGHSDVAPTRKADPGELFPWRELHQAGIGHYVRPTPTRPGAKFALGDRGEDVIHLRQLFRNYGYGIAVSDEFDAQMEAVVVAFQRHFRPARVDGIVDVSTRETLDRLIGSLPSGLSRSERS